MLNYTQLILIMYTLTLCDVRCILVHTVDSEQCCMPRKCLVSLRATVEFSKFSRIPIWLQPYKVGLGAAP